MKKEVNEYRAQGPFVLVDNGTEEGLKVSMFNVDGSQNVNISSQTVDVQTPLPTDGDSVYNKDVWVEQSDMNTFTGSVTDLFDNLHTVVVDDTANNPKEIFIHFNRTLPTVLIAMGAHTGDFSNVKITGLVSGGTEFTLVDDSADNTKLETAQYQLLGTGFNALRIQFHTADTVSVSNLFIVKTVAVIARITGQKPDNSFVEFQATQAGNFKSSIEEFDNVFNELPLPVTDMMLFIARGLRVGVSGVNKYGKATDGIQLTPTDVWDRADAVPTQQIWLAPTASRIHTIVSSSTADDGTPEGAGAGAQAVRIWYLPDWDTAETFEDVILNGTAGVAMINAAVMINRMKVIPVGVTYAINIGAVSATAAVDATVTAEICIGEGQTLMAIYGVPSVQCAYMTNYVNNAHNVGNPATVMETDFTLLVNEHPDLNPLAFINKSNAGLIVTGSSSVPRKYEPYKKITGPSIIKIQAVSTLADTEGVAEFDLILVDN